MPSGETAWIVDATKPGGGRIRRQFSTRAEAETFRADLSRERQQIGALALALSPRDRADAAEARRLAGPGVSLAECVRFWIQHHPPTVTVAEAVAACVAAKIEAGRRPLTVTDARRRLGTFAASFGTRRLPDVTADDVRGWLATWTGTNRGNMLRAVAALFAFAVRRGWCVASPTDRIDRPTIETRMPAFLRADECARIMAAAEALAPAIVPALALGMFAGLRPNEVRGATWADVDTDGGTVRVLPEVAKTRRARIVDLQPNASEWLARYRRDIGPIAPPFSTYRRALARTLKRAAVRIPFDGLRHTFATFHVAEFRDAPRTAFQLGHGVSTAVLTAHYRGLATRDEAARFWKIMPGDEAPAEQPAAVAVG